MPVRVPVGQKLENRNSIQVLPGGGSNPITGAIPAASKAVQEQEAGSRSILGSDSNPGI